jgi:hypothetical protein
LFLPFEIALTASRGCLVLIVVIHQQGSPPANKNSRLPLSTILLSSTPTPSNHITIFHILITQQLSTTIICNG